MANKDDDEKVGYKRPPKRTQFKKGQSGNKKGRPKKKNDIASVFSRILSEPLTYTEGGTARESTASEIVLYAQVCKAMQGDQTAFSAVMTRAQKCGLISSGRTAPDRGRGQIDAGKAMTEAEWLEAARKQQAASKISNLALSEHLFDE